MKSSIYISTEQIQVVGYLNGKVAMFVHHDLPEGVLYNGKIMDSILLTECLTSLKKDYPQMFKSGVALVVDGSTILTRNINTPTLSHKNYLQLVRDDFAGSFEDKNDFVCGYHKFQPGAILGCAVNKTFVDSYISTFKESGIKINAIHIGVETIINFVKSKDFLQKSTIIVNVLDGQTILSMVFVNGDNVFIQRTRLYGETRSEILENILDNLGNLLQFTQSQNHGAVTASYYFGLGDADVYQMNDIGRYENVKFSALKVYAKEPRLTSEVHFAALSFEFSKKSINLFTASAELDKYIKNKKPKKWWIPTLAIYILAFGGVAGWNLFNLNKINNEIYEINNFLTSPEVEESIVAINQIISEVSFFNYIQNQVNERAAWESSMPAVVSSMINYILFDHGLDVQVSSFTFTESLGIVRINAVTTSAQISNDYVDLLYDIGLASHVTYLGYSSAADGTFSFSVDITLYVNTNEMEEIE